MSAPSARPPIPNLLVEGTALAGLARVPDYAGELWARIHVAEGRVVQTNGLLCDRFSESFDRLGLAEVARAEIERFRTGLVPPRSIWLRYHAVALFEHLGRLLRALSTLVREHYEVDAIDAAASHTTVAPTSEATLANPSLVEQVAVLDATLGEQLERRRAALQRIEKLAAEAGRPAALRFASPEAAAAWPADAGEIELNELGVGPAEGAQRREWLPIPELATAMVADAALVLEDVARAVIRRREGGGKLELDLRIEVG